MGTVHAKEAEAASSGPVSLQSVNAQVTKVFVDGVERTKEDVILSQVKPIFKAAHFEELLLKAQDARNNLQDLGCFSDVDIRIDTATGGGPDDYEVTFQVTELKRARGTINTMVGNQEGSLLTGLAAPNLLGRGERFQIDYTHGTKRTSTFNSNFVKPLHDAARTAVGASIFQQLAEFPPSGFRELNRGLGADLSFVSGPQMQHNVAWEGVWRELRPLNRTTAFAVREHSGHTLKSSLRHVLTCDRRDNAIFPSVGSLLRMSQEFAGIGGDVGFFKNDVEVQANIPLLLEHCSLQASLNAGFLRTIDPNSKTVTVADKFFLGGPLNLRGFDMRGVGPSSDGNAVGGTAYWAAGLHLYTPLPLRPHWGGFGDLFRTHVFLNAGNIGDFAAPDRMTAEELFGEMRLSYGLGLAFKLGGIARIELNYCIPVKSQRGDKMAPGLQFGVGVNFL